MRWTTIVCLLGFAICKTKVDAVTPSCSTAEKAVEKARKKAALCYQKLAEANAKSLRANAAITKSGDLQDFSNNFANANLAAAAGVELLAECQKLSETADQARVDAEKCK